MRRLTGVRSLSPGIYILLTVVVAIICGLATPNFTRAIVPSVNGQSVAQTSPQPSPESQSAAEQAEQIAREHYRAGRFNEAAESFQQAAQHYESQGDVPRQAINLSNLSLTYQQLGLWNEAEQAIETSLELVENGSEIDRSPTWQSALAQILDIRGSLELARGQTEQAITTWERTAAIYQQLGKPEQAAESQINQARALQSLGLYNQAIGLLGKVLQAQQPSPALRQALQSPQPLAAWLQETEEDTSDTLMELLQNAEENAPDTLVEQRDQLRELKQWLDALPAFPTAVVALQNLGEALQVVGDLEQSRLLLLQSLELAERLPLDEPIRSETIAAANLSLGNVIRTQAVADLRLNNMTIEEALTYPKPGLSLIQQELQRRQIEAAAQFDAQTTKALDYYEQAVSHSNTRTTQAQAQLNRLSLTLDKQQWSEAGKLAPQIEPLLGQLPPSRATVDAYINLAQSLMRVGGWAIGFPSPPSRLPEQLTKAEQLLTIARQQASDLDNAQAESYALGLLSEVYEHAKQFSEAEQLTKQALEKVYAASATNIPHAINDADLAYRWQQKIGRIRNGQGDTEGAIEAYEEAVKILQDWLRADVASSNLNYQFSFREDAEPVYRGLLDLLLKDPTQKHLQQTREVIASLLETELTSFLQEPCDVVPPEEIDRVIRTRDLKAAVIYPIILDDRLELISKFPGENHLYHYPAVSIARDVLLEKIKALQLALEEDYTFVAVQEASQEFYQWIVQPVEETIAEKAKMAGKPIEDVVDTLVFALDRPLQSIPMAVLYDGDQYLIEKFAISEVLGLRLEGEINPLPEQQQLRVLAAGLSKIPDGVGVPDDIRLNFLPLTQVPDELDALEKTGISVTPILDNSFTRDNFNVRLNQDTFPIVHLATHGIFSVDPERTFLLTYGNIADDVKIEVNELASLFRQRGQIRPDAIELLVLNACETAAGDDSATLGIAGTAVRAGARSVIASLWTLGDAPSVKFTEHFYENLKAGNEDKEQRISKAEALRRAQQALMDEPQYKHPRYWAPYILAGNWL